MKNLFSILVLSLITITSARSQTVDEILGKYFESIGGIEKVKSVNTLKMIGVLPTPQGEFDFELAQKTPNMIKITVTVMGQTMVPQAYDGNTGWMLNPFTGSNTPEKLPDDQTKALMDEAEFEDPFIDYAKKGHAVTYEGTGEVDGINCFILKLVKNKGIAEKENTSDYYFDGDSYLPLMVKQTPENGQMAGQEVMVYFSDYQDAGDGLIKAYTMDSRIDGQSVQMIKFKTIVVNEEIPDEFFKFPGDSVPAVN